MIENVKKSKEPEFETILPGGVGEFFHSFARGGVAIGLRIPIYEVKDIDSAIAKAKDAGFDATKVMNYSGYKYLEICKYGYKKEDDQKVVEELKKVAIEVSKEDYLDHIEKLNFQTAQESSNTNMAQNDLNRLEDYLDPISKLKKLGIPLFSNEKELPLEGKDLILFASKHNNTKEGEYLENILNRLLEDGKKRVIVLFETVSDPAINELLNNPEADEETIKKYYIPMFGFPEAAGNIVFALRNVLHKYGTDRFEIVPIDVTPKVMADKLRGLISDDEYQKIRYETIVNNVLKWYAEKKNTDNTVLLAFTGGDHTLDIYKELMKNGKKEEIDKRVGVFVAPESKNNEDLSSILRI